MGNTKDKAKNKPKTYPQIKNPKKLKPGKKSLAEQADILDCYQKSVQAPEHEVAVFDQVYHQAYKRKALTLREDFCGTFSVCCEWAKSDEKRQAWGIDLCSDTLQWGEEHNLSALSEEAAARVSVLEQDVREGNTPPVDVLAAQNFSFWIFKTRQELLDYFKKAYANLNKKGVMVLDMMGGKDCYDTDLVEKRTIEKGKKGFKYHWEQAAYNPVTSDCSFYIHFKFADGSKIKRAFEYHWRLWTLPEIRELLAEAGFKQSLVYWQDEDEDDEEEAEWEAVDVIDNDDCWLCYLVAIK